MVVDQVALFDHQSLHSCARVNKEWLVSARRHIFHFLSFSLLEQTPGTWKLDIAGERPIKLAALLRREPHLGALVKHLRVCFWVSTSSKDRSYLLHWQAKELFVATILQLPDVRKLTITSEPLCRPVTYSDLRYSTMPPAIHSALIPIFTSPKLRVMSFRNLYLDSIGLEAMLMQCVNPALAFVEFTSITGMDQEFSGIAKTNLAPTLTDRKDRVLDCVYISGCDGAGIREMIPVMLRYLGNTKELVLREVGGQSADIQSYLKMIGPTLEHISIGQANNMQENERTSQNVPLYLFVRS